MLDKNKMRAKILYITNISLRSIKLKKWEYQPKELGCIVYYLTLQTVCINSKVYYFKI